MRKNRRYIAPVVVVLCVGLGVSGLGPQKLGAWAMRRNDLQQRADSLSRPSAVAKQKYVQKKVRVSDDVIAARRDNLHNMMMVMAGEDYAVEPEMRVCNAWTFATEWKEMTDWIRDNEAAPRMGVSSKEISKVRDSVMVLLAKEVYQATKPDSAGKTDIDRYQIILGCEGGDVTWQRVVRDTFRAIEYYNISPRRIAPELDEQTAKFYPDLFESRTTPQTPRHIS